MKEKIKIVCPEHKNISKVVSLKSYEYVYGLLEKFGSGVKISNYWLCRKCGKFMEKSNNKNRGKEWSPGLN